MTLCIRDRWSLAALAFLLLAPGAMAGDVVGETSYLDGAVEVYRGGGQLDPDQVEIGSPVENCDIIRTGGDGTMEIILVAGASPDSSIRVDPNTSFTVEISSVKGHPKTTVNMISGTVALKVRKIAGSGSVDVKTESAVMGVRGTDFAVTTPPSGDILVTCSDGQVACTDEGGTELIARPGTAVEKIPGERFRTIPVAVSSLDAFQKQWNAERIGALRANAARAIQGYAARYDELSKRFDAEYRSLMEQAEVLNTWGAEDESGQVPASDSARTMSEKKKVIGSLFKLRSTLFVFERVYFRLVELQDYHRGGYGRGKLSGGETTDQFFARFGLDRSKLAKRMSLVQYAARLYAARNNGEFPAGVLGGSTEDDGFGGEDLGGEGFGEDEEWDF